MTPVETAGSHPWRPARVLVHVEEAFGAVLLAAIVVLVSLQILGRYVITAPLVWTDELARLSLVWLTFVGASFVMARGEHITIHLFEKFVHPRVIRGVDVFAMLVVLGTCLAFLPGTAEVLAETSDVTSPALGFPRSLIYAAATTGLALIAVHAAVRIIAVVTGRDRQDSEETSVESV